MIEAQEEKAKKPKKDKDKKEEKKPVTHRPEGSKEISQLVRVSGVVVNGNLDVVRAIMKVKGVGPRVSRIVVHALNMPKDTKIGTLDEDQIRHVEEGLSSMNKHMPVWMLNRRKDKATGENLHLIGPTLDMQIREDINLEKKMKSYRGVRHSLGQPVRGQRTRSSFRTGGTIGVSRKKNAAQAAAKSAEDKKEKK